MTIKMKKTTILLFLVFLALNSFGQPYSIYNHSIDIDLDAEGNATITERFYVFFASNASFNQFKEDSAQLGVDLEKWKEYDSDIRTHIGSQDDLKSNTGRLSFIEAPSDEKYIEITYQLTKPITVIKTSTSRLDEFEISKPVMQQFLERPFYVIPANTFISFILPPQSTIEPEDISPAAGITDTGTRIIVTWKESRTNDLSLDYKYWKQIAPRFSISFTVKNFIEKSKNEILWLTVAVIIALILLTYYYRKPLTKQAQDYIIANTEFGSEEEED